MTAIAALSGETTAFLVDNFVQEQTSRVRSSGTVQDSTGTIVLNYEANSGDFVKATFEVARSDGDDMSALLAGTGNKSYRVTVEEVV